ncbi:MAG: hemerythrin domain-containing protein [Actinomycetes bacterium]
MDAITLLREDHRTVEKLFKEFEKAGPRAGKTKAKLVKQIITELAVHAAIEEQVFYPAVRDAVEDTDALVLEALEEHHIVKWVLSELENMTPDDERFVAKVTVLIENVRHHVEEEQDDLFPEVRRALGRKQLAELGEALAKAKKAAPTRPHPKAPDEPPGNVVAGAVSGAMDRARDALHIAS